MDARDGGEERLQGVEGLPALVHSRVMLRPFLYKALPMFRINTALADPVKALRYE